MASTAKRLTFAPLRRDRWADFVQLFGPRGACGGCWCMTPRLSHAEYERNKGDGKRAAMQRLVERGSTPGVLAFRGGEPVGWCAVAPREDYARIERSRVLARVDARAVWSIACLFVRKDQRGKGLSVALLRAAAKWAKSRGATLVEGYPVEPKQKPMPAVFAYTGTASAFRRVGFVEVARRSPTRPIMRLELRPASAAGKSRPRPPRARAGAVRSAGRAPR